MQPGIPETPGRVGRLADRALIGLTIGAAFALGCQELVDSDVWWHVRAGRWILENKQIPQRDPFTFGAADRPWIDLHWLFQLPMALAYAAGGTTGLVLLAAALCAAVATLGVAAQGRGRPVWLAAACWLPALVVMSARFAPRPELLSLVALAAYLIILSRADDRPARLWMLPAVQAAWVNAQGLFVLGPIVLGLYLTDRLAGPGRRSLSASGRIHLLGAAGAVVLACLVNPYGIRGALLPFELFPKITAWGDLYKTYIIELLDLRTLVARQGVPIAAASPFNRALCLVLWALPLSWIVPSAWRAARTARQGTGDARPAVLAIATALVLILIAALGLPGRGTPPWIVAAGRLAPAGMIAVGLIATLALVRSSRRSALIVAIGGASVAAWMAWLRMYLFGEGVQPGLVPTAWAAGVLGLLAAVLAIQAGARVFRIALAVTFGYLGLQAIRNASLLGLAAGHVLAANLGDWAAELLGDDDASQRPRQFAPSAMAARAAVAGLAILLIAATVSDRLFRATGDDRRAFGLSASPTAYAHDAARFASRPGLPGHALVYSLRQAGVYVFHNGPARKVFVDGRLEVPDRETFAAYVRLERMLSEGARGWQAALRGIGDPLVLLDHERHAAAEATLLADPEWRCVWFDPVASVFLARRGPGGGTEAVFPSVDFRARHFARLESSWRTEPGATLAEAEGKALLSLALAMRGRSGVTWADRAAVLLPAFDRLRRAEEDHGARAATWASLAESIEALHSELGAPAGSLPAGPGDPWDPAGSLLTAQATWCNRRALAFDPGEGRALVALYRSFSARRMGDACAAIAAKMEAAYSAAAGQGAAITIDLPASTHSESEAAVRLVEDAESHGVVVPWPARDRAAVALLHLGRPAEARRIWLRAADAPSTALRSARTGAAAMAALDFATARRDYRDAAERLPDLAEAWLGMALLHVELGEADLALAACRAGRKCPLTPAQASFLDRLGRLVGGLTPRPAP